MTQRVVYGALPGGGYGLRVSRPGYNVLNTGLQPNQVSFDSRWSRAARIHKAGTRSSGGTVYFDKTFDTPPLVYVVCSHPDGRHRHGGDFGEIHTFKDRVTFSMYSPNYYPLTYVVVQP